jgi:hypothetical protein
MDGHDQRTALKQTSSRAIATRAAQWRRWQKEADSIWKAHPNLSRHSVARLVKKRLEATQQTDSIARRIRERHAGLAVATSRLLPVSDKATRRNIARFR